MFALSFRRARLVLFIVCLIKFHSHLISCFFVCITSSFVKEHTDTRSHTNRRTHIHRRIQFILNCFFPQSEFEFFLRISHQLLNYYYYSREPLTPLPLPIPNVLLVRFFCVHLPIRPLTQPLRGPHLPNVCLRNLKNPRLWPNYR